MFSPQVSFLVDSVLATVCQLLSRFSPFVDPYVLLSHCSHAVGLEDADRVCPVRSFVENLAC